MPVVGSAGDDDETNETETLRKITGDTPKITR